MAERTQTRRGICPTHGQVEATREVPGVTFPFLLYGYRRFKARHRPFRCPTCGSETTMTRESG
ncbi:MAG TPA: hypothetical protein VGU73_04510 [Acidimicrobiia bacterium]|nr:hypothetical protein [Acidimicrobiia bacterium]